ncbi:MAG: exodeoxyribonuclease VII small subunit [Rhodospirillales bacterium]|nr:exodeoxyribonuclease VII small subunit [Rhodospirillales bacterium]
MGQNSPQEPVSPDIAALSFEDALAELEVIVRRLEEGSIKLDEAISAYERGTYLKRHCEAKLQNAQLRVEKIILGTDGRPVGTEPLDPE